jgi:hypothetical protein
MMLTASGGRVCLVWRTANLPAPLRPRPIPCERPTALQPSFSLQTCFHPRASEALAPPASLLFEPRTPPDVPPFLIPSPSPLVAAGPAGSISPLLRSESARPRTIAAPSFPARVASAPVCRPSIKQLRELEREAAGGAQVSAVAGVESEDTAGAHGIAQGAGAAARVPVMGAEGVSNTAKEEARWAGLGRVDLAASLASTVATCSGGEDTEGGEHPPTDGEDTEGGCGRSTDCEWTEEEGGAWNGDDTGGGGADESADPLAATIAGLVSPPSRASRRPRVKARRERGAPPAAPGGAAVGWRIVDELFPDAEASLFPVTDTDLDATAQSTLAREEGDTRRRYSQPTLASLQ